MRLGFLSARAGATSKRRILSNYRAISPRRAVLAVAAAAAMAASAKMATAANLSWDPFLTVGGTTGGTGTWDLATTSNWFDGVGADIKWTDSTGTADTAFFGGVFGNVTLNSNLGALGLSFGGTGYTMSGTGTLTLGASGIDASLVTTGSTLISSAISLQSSQTWNIGTGSTFTASGIISGGVASTLNKSGSGILYLTGNNIYSGGTQLNAGTLSISTDANIGGASSAITFNGGILQIIGTSITSFGAHTVNLSTFAGGLDISNPNNTFTLSTPIAGSGSFNKLGLGTLTLPAMASYTGTFTLSNGKLNLGAAGALGSGTFNITGTGVGFSAGNQNEPTIIIDNTSGGALALGTNNPMNWNGNNNTGFVFQGSNDLDLGTGAVTITANVNRIITVVSHNLIVGGAIGSAASTGTLTKQGLGTLTLTGTSTYSGTTSLLGGVLSLGTTGQLPSATNLMLSGGELSISGVGVAGPRTQSLAVLNVGIANQINRGTITLIADPGQSNTLTFASLGTRVKGAEELFRGTNLGSAPGNGVASILFSTPPAVTLGTVDGNFLSAVGTAGTSGTTGAAVIRGALADTSATGTGIGFATYDPVQGVRLLNPTTEQVSGTTATTYTTTATVNDNVKLFVPSATTVATPIAFTGKATNTLELNNLSSNGSRLTITNSGTALNPTNGLLFSGTAPITLTGGTLNTNGADTIVLSTNTAGVIISTSLSNAASANTQHSVTFGGPGNITASGTVVSSGAGGIFVNGPGTVTLTAANSPSSTGLVVGGGTAKFGGSFSWANSRPFRIAAGATIDTGGVAAINSVDYVGDLDGAGGTLTNTGATASTITLVQSTATINNFSGVITNGTSPLNLVLNGTLNTATQVLSGSNSYTGTTTITAGNLRIGNNNALPAATALSVNGSAAVASTLDLNGYNPTVASLTGTNTQAGATIMNNMSGLTSTLTVNGAASTQYDGQIVDNNTGTGGIVALVRAGTGTLTLSDFNTYSGGTTINGGILKINGGSVTGTGPVAVNNGGTLSSTNGNTGSSIAGAVTVNPGGILAPGITAVGTLNLNSSLTLSPSGALNSILNYDFNNTTSDMAAVSGTLTLNGATTGTTNRVGINVYAEGTTNQFAPAAATTYDLFSYGALAGTGIGALNVLNPLNTETYLFGISGNFVTLTITPTAAVGVWTNASNNGKWGTGTNWNPNGSPNGVGASATFDNTFGPGTTVTLDTNQTVGAITFNNFSTPYVITAGSPGGFLNMDNGTVAAGINSLGFGSNEIQAPIRVGGSNGAGTLNTLVSVSNSSDTLTISGAVTGSGGLVKNGLGTLVLTNSNGYLGGTTINGGKVQISSNTSLGAVTGVLVINNGILEVMNSITTSRNFKLGDPNATIQVDGTSTYEIDGNITDGSATGALNLTTNGGGASILTLTGANTYSGGTVINTGTTLNVGTGGATGSVGSGGVTLNGPMNVNRTGTITLTGSLSGTAPLAMAGGGTLSLAGANTTYTGDVTVTNSTLNVGSTSANASGTGLNLNLNNAALTATASGTLSNGGTSLATALQINITGGLTINPGTSNLTLASVLNSGTGTTVERTGGTGTLIIGIAANTTISNMTGFNGVFQNDSGPLTLAARGSGTATADWIFNGTDPVNIGPVNASISFGSLSGTAPIIGGAARLVVGGLNRNTSYTGNISGNFGLNKQGTGSLTLNGQNIFSNDAATGATGSFVIDGAGTLVAGSSSNATAGPFGADGSFFLLGNITGLANATYSIGGAFTVGNAITVSGGTTATAPTAYTLTLGGITDNNATFSGVVTLQTNLTVSQVATTGANALTLSGGLLGTASGTGPITSTTNVSPNNTGLQIVTFAGAGKINVTGPITNGGGIVGLIQGGTGLVTISNTTNAYSGGTTVNSGTLVFASTTARPTGDVLTLNATAGSGGKTVIQGDAANLIATYQAALAGGYNGGNWSNVVPGGIASTTATLANFQSIGYMSGAEYLLLHPAGAFAAGYTVTASDVLLRYTYEGDATLDGKITVADYAQIDSAFLLGPTTGRDWMQGDFNFDGVVNYQDYALIDAAFVGQSGPLADGEISEHAAEFGAPYLAALDAALHPAPVPEPASLALLGWGAMSLLRRKRREEWRIV